MRASRGLKWENKMYKLKRSITCNSLEARGKSRVHGAIGFGFASHWLKNWRESFKPITKRSNRNHVITFDSYLKTAIKISTEKREITKADVSSVCPLSHWDCM